MDGLPLVPLDLQVHLVRHRQLDSWQHAAMASPIWRLYWNPTAGAWIKRHGQEVFLQPSHAYLISPGDPVQTRLDEACEHIFCHFSLGPRAQLQLDQIYAWQLTDEELVLWGQLQTTLRQYNEQSINKNENNGKDKANGCGISHALQATNLITHFLQKIPENDWRPPISDWRILSVLESIHHHIDRPQDASALAEHVHMHPKSLGRLFTQVMGITLHQYGMRHRLQHGMHLLLNSSLSVEDIAQATGFSDRFHLSKALSKHYHTTPGKIRRGQHN